MEIESGHAKLFYSKSGNGAKSLLLFHGFGQDHTVFNLLVSELKETHTCFSFDLFFHGNSSWDGPERPVSQQEWKTLITRFLEKENVQNFSVLGYSLGGRPAIATYGAFPSRTDQLILVAAEGIRYNFWYQWATMPWIGRPLFRKLSFHPTLLNKAILTAENLGIISRSVARFASKQMSLPAMRHRVYHSWIAFRSLGLSVNSLKKLALQSKTQLKLIFGANDPIISPNEIKSIRQLPKARIEVIDVGHHGLLRKMSHHWISG